MDPQNSTATRPSVECVADELANDAPALPLVGKPKRQNEESSDRPPKRRKSGPSEMYLEDTITCAKLPLELWQHICLFLSPISLGRLLQTNRFFYRALTSNSLPHSPIPSSGCLKLRDAASVWSLSRQRHFPGAPKPLANHSERDIWRLLLGTRCQFCQESGGSYSEPCFESGGNKPVDKLVVVVWAFGIRTCEMCLRKECIEEKELLFSSIGSLLSGLPVAFTTQEHIFVPSSTIRSGLYTPQRNQILRIYYRAHVNAMQEQLKATWSRDAEEGRRWFQDSEQRATDRMKEAEVYEIWESKFLRGVENIDVVKTAYPVNDATSAVYALTRHSPNRSSSFAPSMDIDDSVALSRQPSQHTQSMPNRSPQPSISHNSTTSRPDRNVLEANDAKASRKAEIERRCLGFEPPLRYNILRHMDAFKAAVQIATPLTSRDWEYLQDRFVEQRNAAEAAELEQESQVSEIKALSSREVQDALKRERDEQQRPTRDRLSKLADEYIHSNWADGSNITHENASKFAADVLIHLRKIFYPDLTEAALDPKQNKSLMENQRTSFLAPKLVLDHMKWVFNNKIKPFTKTCKKELFLCHSCPGRYFGFESVIQHYASRHTNNSSVIWQEAEWPLEPPFHPDPDTARDSQSIQPGTPGQGYTFPAYPFSGQSRLNTITPQLVPAMLSTRPSPVPFKHHAQDFFNGPYPPPGIAPHNMPHEYPVTFYASGYQSHLPINVPADPRGNILHQSGQVVGGVNGSFPHMPSRQTTPAVALTEAGPQLQNQGNLSGQSYPSHSSSVPSSLPTSISTVQARSERMGELFRVAQNIWSILSPVSDFPDSIICYATIHQVIDYFKLRFGEQPDLPFFIEALTSPSAPTFLRQISRLHCKSCFRINSQVIKDDLPHRKTHWNQTSFSFMDLVVHFHSTHINALNKPLERPFGHRLDWKIDMIHLPSEPDILNLIHSTRMDEDAFQLLVKVFPSVYHRLPVYDYPISDPDGVHTTRATRLASVDRTHRPQDARGDSYMRLDELPMDDQPYVEASYHERRIEPRSRYFLDADSYERYYLEDRVRDHNLASHDEDDAREFCYYIDEPEHERRYMLSHQDANTTRSLRSSNSFRDRPSEGQSHPVENASEEAAQFLDSLYPGRELDEHASRSVELSPRDDDAPPSRWTTNQGISRAISDSTQHDKRDNDQFKASHHDEPSNIDRSRFRGSGPPLEADQVHQRGSTATTPNHLRVPDSTRTGYTYRRSRLPERPPHNRYTRYDGYREDFRPETQRQARARNSGRNYFRYEAQRRRLDQERSRSPRQERSYVRHRTPNPRHAEEVVESSAQVSPRKRFIPPDGNSTLYLTEPPSNSRFSRAGAFYPAEGEPTLELIRIREGGYSPPRGSYSRSTRVERGPDGERIIYYSDGRPYIYREPSAYEAEQEQQQRTAYAPEPGANQSMAG